MEGIAGLKPSDSQGEEPEEKNSECHEFGTEPDESENLESSSINRFSRDLDDLQEFNRLTVEMHSSARRGKKPSARSCDFAYVQMARFLGQGEDYKDWPEGDWPDFGLPPEQPGGGPPDWRGGDYPFGVPKKPLPRDSRAGAARRLPERENLGS